MNTDTEDSISLISYTSTTSSIKSKNIYTLNKCQSALDIRTNVKENSLPTNSIQRGRFSFFPSSPRRSSLR